MSNTVAGRLQFDNSQECIAKKRQWRRHANENMLERNASIVVLIEHVTQFGQVAYYHTITNIYLIIRRCARTGAFPGAFCVPNSVALASLTLQVVNWAIH